MTRNPLVIDLALAALAAILVLIIAPGLAVAGLIALLVLIFAVVSFVRQSRKRARKPSARGRPDQRARSKTRARGRPPPTY